MELRLALVPDVLLEVPVPPVACAALPALGATEPVAVRFGLDPALVPPPPLSSHARFGRPMASRPTMTSFLKMKRDMLAPVFFEVRLKRYASERLENMDPRTTARAFGGEASSRGTAGGRVRCDWRAGRPCAGY